MIGTLGLMILVKIVQNNLVNSAAEICTILLFRQLCMERMVPTYVHLDVVTGYIPRLDTHYIVLNANHMAHTEQTLSF